MGRIVIYLKLSIILLSTTFALHAQRHTPDSVWRKGSVTLNSGEVITGKVIFHQEILMENASLAWAQGVQYKQQNYTSYHVIFNAELFFDDGNKKKCYHGNDIKAFYIAKNHLKPDSLVQYTTLAMPSPRINNARFFFQVIANGPVSLLKRVSIIYQDTIRQETTRSTRKKEVTIATNYYVLNQSAQSFVLVKNNKKSLLRIMQNNKKMKAFIKHEGLELSRDTDLCRLFTYYNSLHTNPD